MSEDHIHVGPIDAGLFDRKCLYTIVVTVLKDGQPVSKSEIDPVRIEMRSQVVDATGFADMWRRYECTGIVTITIEGRRITHDGTVEIPNDSQ